MKGLKKFVCCLLWVLGVSGNLLASDASCEVFSKIYDTSYWGTNNQGEGYSGPGSLLEQTQEYRQFLQQFLKDHNIKTVIDIGCGDWTFSQSIDWQGINYQGYDVVKSVIEKNKARYGTSSINFSLLDGSSKEPFPKADLLLCKDVLQHLSFREIEQFLQNLDQIKYCLITNDIGPSNLALGNFNISNSDIERGGHRFLDLTKAPFSVQAEVVLTYRAGPCWKQVLLIKPPIKKKIPDVVLIGPVGCESLCKFPDLWIEGLSNDVNVDVKPTTCRMEEASPKLKEILSEKGRLTAKVGVLFENVWTEGCNNYEMVPKDCTIKIAYSSYESSVLHPKWVEIFNTHFDAVAVLDPYFKDVYVQSGVKVPVFVLPQGLNLKKYQEYADRERHSSPLVFGCSAAFWSRKNLTLLAQAFAEEFGNSPLVKLKIHGRGGEMRIISELEGILKIHGLENAEIICHRFTASEYIDFINSLDVYTLISQEEGYSISPREAMSLGIPCILSDNTAHKTLCSSGFVKSVKSEKEIVPQDYLGNKEVGFMFDTEKSDLRSALRDMYENYTAYLAKAKQGREWVKKYEMENLKQNFLALVKPKKIVLGNNDKIENGVMTTKSKNLFQKYTSL